MNELLGMLLLFAALALGVIGISLILSQNALWGVISLILAAGVGFRGWTLYGPDD